MVEEKEVVEVSQQKVQCVGAAMRRYYRGRMETQASGFDVREAGVGLTAAG